jgi:uncharacterized protein (UPF0332 family)
MSFDWIEFLTFAERIQCDPDHPGPPEAALRTAASRAYYAAYHCALTLATQEGYATRSIAGDHKGVQAHFRQCGQGPGGGVRKKISKELGRLLNHRHWADYDDVISKKPESLAEHAVGMAQRIIANLDSLTPYQS